MGEPKPSEPSYTGDPTAGGGTSTFGQTAPDLVFANLKQSGREQIRGNIFKWLLVSIVLGVVLYGVLMGIILAVGGPLFAKLEGVDTADPQAVADVLTKMMGTFYLIVLLSMVAQIFITGITEWGQVTLNNNMYKGEQIKVAHGFAGFKQPGAAISIYFSKTLCLALWSLLMIVPIIGIPVVIAKTYAYSCATYIKQQDSSIGSFEAITRSRELMDGYKMKLFLLDLSFFLIWIIPVIVTFGLAMIYVAPYWSQTRYNFFKQLNNAK